MGEAPLVEAVTVPHQQDIDGAVFPLVLQCSSSTPLAGVADWIAVQGDRLIEQAQRHGAILFRDFPLVSPEDFDGFIAAFDLEAFPYEESLSNAVRINYTPRVFSANEAPSEVSIFLHHEMAQTPVFPSMLFFFCQQPATSGGATPLCRSDVLYDRLQDLCPDFAHACAEQGLRYTTVMPSENDAASGLGRGWQSTFRAASREEAEQRMRALNYSWEWLPDGCLRATTPVLPAVRDLGGGRTSFFNQLIAAFEGWKDSRNDPAKSICFGDGSPLDAGTVHRVAALAEELTFDLQWQAGDVALVDNLATMHARRPFTGTRKVLASLVAAQHHAPV